MIAKPLSDPVNLIDPTGEAAQIIVNVAIEVGIQVFIEGRSLDCLNYASIIAGGGAVGRLLKGGKWLGKWIFGKMRGVTKGGQKLLETPSDVLLRNAQDPRLKDAINNLYRPGAKVGSGSTADAVRFERATGELLSQKGHTQKLLDRRTQLMKLRKDPNLSSGDRRIIHDILKDTQDALSN